jgi:hypothetical protein
MADAITFALGNLGDRAVYVGFMGVDTADIYTFNHPAAGRLNCSLEGFGAGLEVRLKTKDGRTLDRRTVNSHESEAIAFEIPAGFYALEISSTGGSTTYQLTVEQDKNNPEKNNRESPQRSIFYNSRKPEKSPRKFPRPRVPFALDRSRECDRKLNDILWSKKQQILGFCSPHSPLNCPPPIVNREPISPLPRGHPN